MSQAVAHSAEAPALAPPQPAVGKDRISLDEPPKAEGRIDRRTEIALALAILVPTMVAYGAITFGAYHAVNALT
jgi:hypothetical protein